MKDYPFKTQEEAIKYIQKLFRRIGTTPGESFYKESGMKLYPLQKLGFSNYGQLVRKQNCLLISLIKLNIPRIF